MMMAKVATTMLRLWWSPVLIVIIFLVAATVSVTAEMVSLGGGRGDTPAHEPARPEPPPPPPPRPHLPPLGRLLAADQPKKEKPGGRPDVMSNDSQAEAAIRGNDGGGPAGKKDGLDLPTFDSDRGGDGGGKHPGEEGPKKDAPSPKEDAPQASEGAEGGTRAEAGAEAEVEAGATGPAVFTEEVDVSLDPIRIDVSPATFEQYDRLRKGESSPKIAEYVVDVVSYALRRRYDGGGEGGDDKQGRVEFRGMEVDVGDVRYIQSLEEDDAAVTTTTGGRIAILISSCLASFVHSYPLVRGRRLRGRELPRNLHHHAEMETLGTMRHLQASSAGVVLRPPSGEELTEMVVTALNDAGNVDGGGLLFAGADDEQKRDERQRREFPILGESVRIVASTIDDYKGSEEEDVVLGGGDDVGGGGVVDAAPTAAVAAEEGAEDGATETVIEPDVAEDGADTAEITPIGGEEGDDSEEAQRAVVPVTSVGEPEEEGSSIPEAESSAAQATTTTTTEISSPGEVGQVEGDADAAPKSSSTIAHDQKQQQRQGVAATINATQGGGGAGRSGIISPLFLAAAVLGAVFVCSATTFFVWSSRHPESYPPLATRDDLEGKKRREYYDRSSGALTDGVSSSNEDGGVVDGVAVVSSEASSFPSLVGNHAAAKTEGKTATTATTSSSVDAVCDSSNSKRSTMMVGGGVVGDSLRRVVAGVGTIRPARAPLSDQELFVDDDENDDREGVGGRYGRGVSSERRSFVGRGISRCPSAGRIFGQTGRKDGYEGCQDDDDDHHKGRNNTNETVDSGGDDVKGREGRREQDRTKLQTAAAVVPPESDDDGDDDDAAAAFADGERGHQGHNPDKDDGTGRAGSLGGQQGGATASSPTKPSPAANDGLGEEILPSPLATPSPNLGSIDLTSSPEPCDADVDDRGGRDDSIAHPPASPDLEHDDEDEGDDGRNGEDRPSSIERHGMKQRPLPPGPGIPSSSSSSSGQHRHVRSNSFRRLLAAGTTLPPSSSLSWGIGGVIGGGGGGVDRARLIGPNAARSDTDLPHPSSSAGSAIAFAENIGDGRGNEDGPSDEAYSPLVRPEGRSLVSYRMDLVECGDVDDGGDEGGGGVGDGGGGGGPTSSSKKDSVVL